jgi:hypothetical protein
MKAKSYHIAHEKRTICYRIPVFFNAKNIFPPRCFLGKRLVSPLVEEEWELDIIAE